MQASTHQYINDNLKYLFLFKSYSYNKKEGETILPDTCNSGKKKTSYQT